MIYTTHRPATPPLWERACSRTPSASQWNRVDRADAFVSKLTPTGTGPTTTPATTTQQKCAQSMSAPPFPVGASLLAKTADRPMQIKRTAATAVNKLSQRFCNEQIQIKPTAPTPPGPTTQAAPASRRPCPRCCRPDAGSSVVAARKSRRSRPALLQRPPSRRSAHRLWQ